MKTIPSSQLRVGDRFYLLTGVYRVVDKRGVFLGANRQKIHKVLLYGEHSGKTFEYTLLGRMRVLLHSRPSTQRQYQLCE